MKLLFSFIFFISICSTSYADNTGNGVPYSVDGKTYEGYYAVAKAGAPLVILIHDWDGLTGYEKMRAKMLVELGYNVFAADLYGAGVRPVEIKDKKQQTGALYKDRPKMRKLIQAAVTQASDLGLDTQNAVIAGYCFGGAAVLEFARSGADLKGFVSFHGGLATPEGQDYESAQGKYLILHGTADAMISMNDFAALAVELEEEDLNHEMVSYSGAPHAFTVYGSKNYHKEADLKSWRQFTQWLDSTLQGK
ncbi:dienelactone hydrolase family protein [Desulforhopalus sp. 52FAK]